MAVPSIGPIYNGFVPPTVDPVIPTYIRYKLDETSGTVLTNSGTLGGSANILLDDKAVVPLLSAGKWDNAITFSGTDSTNWASVSRASHPAWYTTGMDYTFCFWWKRRGSPINIHHDFGQVSQNVGGYFYTENGDFLVKHGANNCTFALGTGVHDGEWHHIAFGHDASENTSYCWLDGAPLTPQAHTAPAADSGTFTFRIGRRTSAPANGSFDEFRVYQSLLTDDAVMRIVQTNSDLDGDMPADPDWAPYLYKPIDVIMPSLSATYTNPTDRDEVSLDAVFTSPTGNVINRRGFRYVDYTETQTIKVNSYSKEDRGSPYYTEGDTDWRVRFTPEEIGVWGYEITLTDTNGTVKGYGNVTVTRDESKDWLGRVMWGEYRKSLTYVSDPTKRLCPVGWSVPHHSLSTWRNDIEVMDGKINVIRAMNGYMGYNPDCNYTGSETDSTNLATGLGDYSGIGEFEMWRLEQVLDLCYEHDITVMMTLTENGPETSYNTSLLWAGNGGPCNQRIEFYGYLEDWNLNVSTAAGDHDVFDIYVNDTTLETEDGLGNPLPDTDISYTQSWTGAEYTGPWVLHCNPSEDCQLYLGINNKVTNCYFMVEVDGSTVWSELNAGIQEIYIDVPAGTSTIRYGFGGTNQDLDNPASTATGVVEYLYQHRLIGYRAKPDDFMDSRDYKKHAWAYMMDRIGDHPAIFGWQVENEAWNSTYIGGIQDYEHEYMIDWYNDLGLWLQENDPWGRPVIPGGDNGREAREGYFISNVMDIGDSHVYDLWWAKSVKIVLDRMAWDADRWGSRFIWGELGNFPCWSPHNEIALGPVSLRTLAAIGSNLFGFGQINFTRTELSLYPDYPDAFEEAYTALETTPVDCVNLFSPTCSQIYLETPEDIWLCVGYGELDRTTEEQYTVTVNHDGLCDGYGEAQINGYIAGDKWWHDSQEIKLSITWLSESKLKMFVSDIEDSYSTILVKADGVVVETFNPVNGADENTWIECTIPSGTELVTICGDGNNTTSVTIDWIVLEDQQTHRRPYCWGTYGSASERILIMNPEHDAHIFMGEPGPDSTYPNMDTPRSITGSTLSAPIMTTGVWSYILYGPENIPVDSGSEELYSGDTFTLELPELESYFWVELDRTGDIPSPSASESSSESASVSPSVAIARSSKKKSIGLSGSNWYQTLPQIIVPKKTNVLIEPDVTINTQDLTKNANVEVVTKIVDYVSKQVETTKPLDNILIPMTNHQVVAAYNGRSASDLPAYAVLYTEAKIAFSKLAPIKDSFPADFVYTPRRYWENFDPINDMPLALFDYVRLGLVDVSNVLDSVTRLIAVDPDNGNMKYKEWPSVNNSAQQAVVDKYNSHKILDRTWMFNLDAVGIKKNIESPSYHFSKPKDIVGSLVDYLGNSSSVDAITRAIRTDAVRAFADLLSNRKRSLFYRKNMLEALNERVGLRTAILNFLNK